MECQELNNREPKPMKTDLCILIPVCCRGGTKPIDGAILLGNEKIFTRKIHHVTYWHGIYLALASS